MRVASLVPSATRILRALDLQHLVVACTHACGLKGVPLVATSTIDVHASAGATAAAVHERVREGRPVVAVDGHAIVGARPDVVFVQDLCDVCAVGLGPVQRLSAALPEARIVPLSAASLEGMMEDVERVGAALDRSREAAALAGALRSRAKALGRRTADLPRRRVAVVEWLDPPFTAGHWAPEQVALAGGADVLAAPGERSRPTTWEVIAEAAPEVVVLAPCGWGLARARDEARRLGVAAALAATPAGGTGDVFVIDADRYTSCPGPDLVEGAALMASLVHPDAVPRPTRGEGWDRLAP